MEDTLDIASIAAGVNAINLDAVMGSAVKREGLPADRAPAAVETYRQFLTLVAAYPKMAICVPSDADKIWHQHILATGQYAKDCTALCGRSIHHDPTAFGTPEFHAAWAETAKLYKDHFGVDLDSDPTALDRTPLSAATCYRPADPQDDLPDELPPMISAH